MYWKVGKIAELEVVKINFIKRFLFYRVIVKNGIIN